MANRTVSVRYILDASGYRSGANDIAAADARIAASARAAAATMDQQQAKATRGQQKATKAYVASGKAQADAITKVGKASAASTRIIEDAERRKVRIQEDSTRRIARVNQDAAAQMLRTTNEQKRQQIAASAAVRQARIREEAATRASRIGEDANVRASRSVDTGASLQQTAQAYSQVGRTALVTGGLIAAGLGLSARAAIQWQSDFTGVTKTVDGSAQQLGALELQLRGLSRTMPQSSTQIAGVAEAAGQLGIQTGSIAQFTKTMLQLGDTTNLTSDEAATSIAQLGNIMGTLDGPANQVNDNIARVGSTIVGLGNDGASTERDIVNMGLRIASAGKTIGLNTGQVLGFSSAIASTGVDVEAGGTAFSNFALKVDSAVREGGPKLDLLAKTAGQTGDEFRKSFSADSAGAIQDFIEGLDKVQQSGGDSNKVLRDLGVTGVREGTVIRNLAASHDKLAAALKGQARFYKENTALSNEATKRYETDASRIQIAVNKIKDDAIDIGSAVLPVISSVTEQVSKYADAFKNLSPETQGSLVKGGAVAAGILLVGGASLSAAGSVAQLASGLAALGATKAGVAGLAASLGPIALVAAAGYAALRGIGEINNLIKPSIPVSIDTTTNALTKLAQSGEQADLNNLFKYNASGNSGFTKLSRDINGIGDAFKVIDAPTALEKARSIIDPFIKTTGGLTSARQQLDGMDQSLKALTLNGNGGDAAKAFSDIVPQALQAGRTVNDLATKDFPLYRQAVVNATEANGYHIASDQEMVDIMSGKIPQSLADAAKGNKNLAGAVNAVTGANINGVQTFTQQLTAIQGNVTGLLGLRSAHNSVEGAIDAANAAIKQNGKTLDVGTEKGRANRQALDNIAVGAQNYTTALGKQGKSALQIVEANEKARQSYVKLARSAGQSKGDATRNANELFKLPKNVTTQVAVKVSGASSKQIHDLNEDIQKLPKEQRAKIVTIAEDKGLKAAKTALKEFEKPKTQKVKTEYDKGKQPPKPKDQNYKVHAQFANPEPPKIPDGVQKIKQEFADSPQGDVQSAKKSRVITFKSKVDPPKIPKSGKGGTVNFKSKVDPPKVPKAGKGGTINYKSKAEAPKAPKAPKGATITFKVKVDKVGKIAVPKGGTVKIKTDVDLSGVRRAKSGVSGVKGKSVKVKTTADLSGVNSVRSALNSVNSKTVTITTVKKEVTQKAGGGKAVGKVTGPGTNTSDSIEAMLSNEEWVIRATSSKMYGDGIMAALNAGSIPKSALEPYSYATGGKAGLPPMGFAKGGKITISQLINAITNDNPLQEVEDAKKGSKEWKAALKEAAKAVRDFGKTLTDQYVSASTSGTDQLQSAQQGIADIKALQAKVDQLQKLGLDSTQIAAIVKRASDGDVAGATALADSIVTGGKPLVDQLNAATKSLAQIANLLAADTQTKKVRAYASGGQASGPGTATSDTAGLYALSNREWVHPVAAVDFYGEAFMRAVQTRTLPKQRVSGYMAQGGQVGVKVVTAPSSTGDFIRALEGVTVMVQSPITGEYLTGHIARVADQRIGSAFTGAGSSR